MELILASYDGAEIRQIQDADFDFDIGDQNDFQITFSRSNWKGDITKSTRIYIPETEYGGITRRMSTDTEEDSVSVGGYSWRGMLANKVIRPPSGQDYKIVSGDLNTIIGELVENEFPGLFYAPAIEAGVNVTSFKFDRYCTLLGGLYDLLNAYGFRLKLKYVQTQPAGYVEISAVPIVDWSDEIELSADFQLDYTCKVLNDGVNHLICLGSGELKNRTVVDLFADQSGKIGTTQYFTGVDEIVDIYDYAGATGEELVSEGVKELKGLINSTEFKMDIASLGFDVDIGDIIGGRDYLTGMYSRSYVSGVIYTCKEGVEKKEYSVEQLSTTNSRETSSASEEASLSYGDYNTLSNKPSIEGVTLVNNKSFSDLGLDYITTSEIDEIILNNGGTS